MLSRLIWLAPGERLRWKLLYRFGVQPPEKAVRRRIRRQFRRRLGRKPDLESPVTFNEKIQVLKLRHRHSEMPLCADKYGVRAHLEKLGMGDLLVGLLGVYDSFGEIDFAKLPERFVLKATHNWPAVFVVKDRGETDFGGLRKRIDALMEVPYIFGVGCGEWQYLHIPPRVVAEEYLEDVSGGLLDYKLHCFHGRPTYVQIDFDRQTAHKRAFYDVEWNDLRFTSGYPLFTGRVARPESLEKMLSAAEELSRPFPYARIDFYDVEGRPYLGEITFFADSGFAPFEPPEWDERLGGLIDLPGTR